MQVKVGVAKYHGQLGEDAAEQTLPMQQDAPAEQASPGEHASPAAAEEAKVIWFHLVIIPGRGTNIAWVL